ncbi:hypothetical protein GE21DRAFT_7238 [Neurospora crassa]|uniref:Uncharacterized protein n=1 Tax=Neurospora crassa (strain ATCC 24698 / 74-OR23-1A / CBS 708.71 / DSM 1257 / FGSC 987) TaxID=367110 RepID=V5ILD4_NEUCR|nr:hypothetical protein NCU03673 [Neurospora crassa OR74A]ESA42432.1 hypothetical protein NCU03673 [Neurospora crassa OR74A]KHE88884.1 hypothetical protein GE21DRAFT_7238 [Neurospora crassa]|eukprot:XP_011394561.1 hypothetical protein NCU03673 [Neurospora crassa OR74A]
MGGGKQMRTRDNGAVLVLGLSNKMIPREAVTLPTIGEEEVKFRMREVIGAETTGSNGVVLSRGRKSAKACIQYGISPRLHLARTALSIFLQPSILFAVFFSVAKKEMVPNYH